MNYLILPASSLIFELMLPPKVWNARTAANATNAAATAYSDNSSPLSSFRNFVNIVLPSLTLHGQPAASELLPARLDVISDELFDLAGQIVDLRADVAAQSLEREDRCQRDERCGDGVL